MNYELTSLSQKPELLTAAAHWFHEKWGIPLEEYQKSMEECLQTNSPVPQWYLALKGTEILTVTRVNAARNLSRLRDEGIIASHRKWLEILDLPALEAYCSQETLKN